MTLHTAWHTLAFSQTTFTFGCAYKIHDNIHILNMTFSLYSISHTDQKLHMKILAYHNCFSQRYHQIDITKYSLTLFMYVKPMLTLTSIFSKQIVLLHIYVQLTHTHTHLASHTYTFFQVAK